jgi:alkylhydroperoxidase family enzyme
MRMHPVDPPYAPEVQKLFDRLPASWAPPFLHFRILARDPRLLAHYLRGAVSYLQPSHVTLRQREVFLLRVTGRCRCAFEWTLRAHYFAEEASLTEAQLRASVLSNAADPCWTGGEAVLVRLADELHDTSSIGDRLWSELRSAVSEEAVLQLSLMAGHYRMNAYLTNGLELPIDSRVRWPFPEA